MPSDGPVETVIASSATFASTCDAKIRKLEPGRSSGAPSPETRPEVTGSDSATPSGGSTRRISTMRRAPSAKPEMTKEPGSSPACCGLTEGAARTVTRGSSSAEASERSTGPTDRSAPTARRTKIGASKRRRVARTGTPLTEQPAVQFPMACLSNCSCARSAVRTANRL